MNTLRVLILCADPIGQPQLRFSDELRNIHSHAQQALHPHALHLEFRFAVQPHELQAILLHAKPHVLHFIGHGKNRELCFLSPTGHTAPLTLEALVQLLRILRDNIPLRLVVLNACHSKDIAHALTSHIPFAVGMNDLMPDESAVAFSGAFYHALASGLMLHQAFELACNAILSRALPGSEIPCLFPHPSDPITHIPLVSPAPKPPPSDSPPPSRRFRAWPLLPLVFSIAALGGLAYWKFPSSHAPFPAPMPSNAPPLASSTLPASTPPSMPPSTPTPSSAFQPLRPNTTNSSSPPPPPEATSGIAVCEQKTCTLSSNTGLFTHVFSACLGAELNGIRLRCLIAGQANASKSVLCNRSDQASQDPFNGTTTWTKCSN